MVMPMMKNPWPFLCLLLTFLILVYDGQEQRDEELVDVDLKKAALKGARKNGADKRPIVSTATILATNDAGTTLSPKQNERAPKPTATFAPVLTTKPTVAPSSTHTVTPNHPRIDATIAVSEGEKKNMTGLPSWSNLPRSQFTDHVLDNIERLHLDTIEDCVHPIHLTVPTPDTVPSNITCKPQENADEIWCRALKRIFWDDNRILPFNVTIGFLLNDFLSDTQVKRSNCFGNSAPNGTLCMPNVQDLGEMLLKEPGRRRPDDYRWDYTATKPWEERHPIPVFRGQAWLPERHQLNLCRYQTKLTYDTILREFPRRFVAVDYSVDHPDLLNARFNALDWVLTPCLEHNATNGLDKLLPVDKIPRTEYFQGYQVAVVLSGIGAAFRTNRHMMTGTAVILQDCMYKEWFTSLLEPFVHYIPLAEDLSDLEETLLWVKNHRKQVKQIAENGLAFYEKYLTFYRHEDHIYEMVYRLSEYTEYMNDKERKPRSNRPPSAKSVVAGIPSPAPTIATLNPTRFVVSAPPTKLVETPPPTKVVETPPPSSLPVKATSAPSSTALAPKHEVLSDAGSAIEIPSWSKMPRSQFTDHVLKSIQQFDMKGSKDCSEPIEFIVQTPHSIPNVSCDQTLPWCQTMTRIFESKTVPYNVSVGFVFGDYKDEGYGNCFGNSAPDGKLCMTNIEEIMHMLETQGARGTEDYRWEYANAQDWEERHTLPIFRGTAWLAGQPALNLCRYNMNLTYSTILREFQNRFKVVDFSVDHPDLLDARFSGLDQDLKEFCLTRNATNGLHKLLPLDPIDHMDYFQSYQVALALPGIGAAFRVSRHFMTGTAVILQEFKYKEWYTPYLKPWEHYIPLTEDLNKLEETLVWVKKHKNAVKRIAENGRAFYEKYLTFAGHEEHFYELVYRLSEYAEYKRTQTPANITDVPHWSTMPRSQFTDHVLENIRLTNTTSKTGYKECTDPIELRVQTPNSVPTVSCIAEKPWCKTLRRIFESQPLPYNVSLGFVFSDYLEQDFIDEGHCFGNAAPNGTLSMPNMEEVLRMFDRAQDRGTDSYSWGYQGMPWDKRNPLPIFRGTAWVSSQPAFDLCLYEPNLTYPVILRDFPRRYFAVDYSVDHPDLLDARFSGMDPDLEDCCMPNNVTNGLHKLLPLDRIAPSEYFRSHQVALALPGIGPAFRVNLHFMTGTAVMLQDFEYKEWYTPYLKPYVHYIPLSRSLDDLEEQLVWVKNHRKEVKEIAENGRSFYEKYLTFAHHEEHIYELVYRLSEYTHYLEETQQELQAA